MVIADLDDQKKVDILLKALEERYKAQQIIRDRIHNVCLWTLGVLLGSGGWLIQSTEPLVLKQRTLFSILVIALVFALRVFYFRDLEKGFKSQQQTGAEIENRLGLYSSNLFGTPSKAVYPLVWQNAGANGGEGKFVNSNYILMYIGAAVLLVIIWVHP